METNPRRYLVRMFIFLLAVGIIAGLLAAPLEAAFMGNPALNGVILGAFGYWRSIYHPADVAADARTQLAAGGKINWQAGSTRTSPRSTCNCLCDAGRFAP